MGLTGHPGLFFLVFWPIAAAFISYGVGRFNKQWRNYFANFAVALEFVAAVITAFSASNAHPPTFEWFGFMSFKIFLTMDGLRCIYVVITALMWMMTTVFSRDYLAHYRNRNRYYFFMLLTLSGTMGVFLSADLVTTFVFFEIMSFTSYVMVIHDETPDAIRASKTYIAVSLIGGLAMIFGILMVNDLLGTTEIGKLYKAVQAFEGSTFKLYMAAAFMLVGFGGKAGVYPLHIWLPTAHPVAPAPASALLSGVLTKTGVYGIIIVSALMFYQNFNWGLAMLVIGLLGMFTGALLALFSVDLKRTLACSSVSQIGFIMVGIGMMCILDPHYNPLAIRGTMLHMINHSLIKLVLFLMAGVVYVNLHRLNLNDVRGFGRGKPLFTFCFLMGVMGIIGIPFWNGYISKTLLHESIVERIWFFADYTFMARFFQFAETIFTVTGGLTTAYMIKIFSCVCIEKNQFNQEKMTALNKKYLSTTNSAVLLICALLLPILGFSPNTFMIPLGTFAQDFMMGNDLSFKVEFLGWANLKGALASLAIGAILYIFIVRGCLMNKDEKGRSVYVNLWPGWLDIEKMLYRPLLLTVLPAIGALAARLIGGIVLAISALGYRGFMAFRSFWHAFAPKRTINAAYLRASFEATCRNMPDISAEHVQAGYEKMRTKTPDISTEALQASYEKIRHIPSGFINRFMGKERGQQFELFKSIINSLAYSLLLFLVGAIIIVAFVLFS